MGQALYRKYRSKSLKEIVGQEHITTTLQKALDSGRISHAYLFTGPRGVGKTSIARILAHAINGLPYDEGRPPIDIIEIDAASNRRIDEIRDLRDKVTIAPANAKYKVYIIDEVHMLTKEAFNALLKTLEEPPAHVVFILATTEAHKLPATIVSRTQRFVFRPIETAQAIKHLRTIAKEEKIAIDDAALELVAQHGGGSFRDSISLLDQAASLDGMITAETIRDMLGIPSPEATASLVSALQTKNPSPTHIIQLLTEQYTFGLQAPAIAEQLAAHIRSQLLEGTIDSAQAVSLLAALLEVGVAANPERYLEIVLLRQTASQAQTIPNSDVPIPSENVAATKSYNSLKSPKTVPQPKTTSTIILPASAKATDTPQETTKITTISATTSQSIGVRPTENKWPEVLARLKKDYNTLYGIVRMAKPDFSRPDELTLTFAFAFHEKRVKESKNQQAIARAIEAVYGQPLVISCVVDPNMKLATKPPKTSITSSKGANPTHTDHSLSTISNIFGAAEVLE